MENANYIQKKMKKMFKYVSDLFCRHDKKKETYRCYQDRFVIEKCENCQRLFYSDL